MQFNSWGPLRPMILYFIIYQFEDTKGVIQTCKSKKDRQHYDQKKKGQKSNTMNDLGTVHFWNQNNEN